MHEKSATLKTEYAPLPPYLKENMQKPPQEGHETPKFMFFNEKEGSPKELIMRFIGWHISGILFC